MHSWKDLLQHTALYLQRVSGILTLNAQVTHSRIERRISHGYNPASFVEIRIGP